jgi:hypothetical protein
MGDDASKRAWTNGAPLLAMGKRPPVRQLMSLVDGDHPQQHGDEKHGRNKNEYFLPV